MLISAEMPSFEIKADNSMNADLLSINFASIGQEAEAETVDVGKQVFTADRHDIQGYNFSLNWHSFFIKSAYYGLRRTDKGYLSKHYDPDSPYTYLKYPSGFVRFGLAST